MHIKYESLNSTGKDGQHLSVIAWKNSRDLTKEPLLKDILAIDIPINEFASAVVNIKSTILEREIITTLRDHVMWARGSRVDDITQWTVPEPYYSSHQSYFDDLKKQMLEQKEKGIKQDQYRLLTPILAETEYTIRINLRAAVKLYLYFLKLQETTELFSLFYNAADAMYSLISRLSAGLADTIIDGARFFDVNPLLESSFSYKGNSSSIGDTMSITMMMPFSMRTHLVRHRSLIIKDRFSAILHDPAIHSFCLNDEIEVQATGDKEFWKEIASNRSCWMAQYDLWKPIVDALIKEYDLGENLLPCMIKESCPFVGDVEQRIKGQDPNAPCPKFALINKQSLTNDQLESIRAQIVIEDRPVFWTDIADGFVNGGPA